MLDSISIDTLGKSDMEDHEIIERRASRQKRIARTKRRGAIEGVGQFFASPYAAIVCMLVALGSIVGFWRGVPSWALLALGVGAVIIIVVAGFFWKRSVRQ